MENYQFQKYFRSKLKVLNFSNFTFWNLTFFRGSTFTWTISKTSEQTIPHLKAPSFTIWSNKVLTFLEACFDLISSSSLPMKIQIMGGKMTENPGFKSPHRKVKKFLFFFLFLFKFFTQNWVSLNLTTYWNLV